MCGLILTVHTGVGDNTYFSTSNGGLFLGLDQTKNFNVEEK